MRNIGKAIQFLLCCTLMLGILASCAAAKVVYVKAAGNNTNDGSSWSNAKATITAGLSLAVSGDQVFVAAGTYKEKITLNSGIALYGGFPADPQDGAGMETRNIATNRAIIDGNYNGSVVTMASGSNGSKLDGFTICHGTMSGIYFSDGAYNTTIANNIITQNSSSYGTATRGGGGGIYINGGRPTICNNIIKGNVAQYAGGGIYCNYSYAKIINNTIVGNVGPNAGGGIFSVGSNGAEKNVLKNNIIAFNGTEVFDNAGVTTQLMNNCLYNETGRCYGPGTDRWGPTVPSTAGSNNFNFNPQLVSAKYGYLHLQQGSPCIDMGLSSEVGDGWLDIDGGPRISGAAVDLGADESDGAWHDPSPRIVRVSNSGSEANDGSSWDNARSDLQKVIDEMSLEGGEVWADAGTYGRINLRSYVYLRGGYPHADERSSFPRPEPDPNASIIDANLQGSAVTARHVTSYSCLDGFEIENGIGAVTLADDGINSESTISGGGILCYCGNPTITNNKIKSNTTAGTAQYSARGGGMALYFSGPTVCDNIISGNSTSGLGGGIYGFKINGGTITRNKITGNNSTSSGAGISFYHCFLNDINPPHESLFAVTSNVIAGNTTSSSGGGISCADSVLWMANNTIIRNTATYNGGAIYTYTTRFTLANNVIAYNSSGISKDEPLSSYPMTAVDNCFFSNGSYNYRIYNGNTPPTYNTSYLGSGDFVQNPGFASSDPYEYHLAGGSQCIDTGDMAKSKCDLDADRGPRVSGLQVDRGADEYDFAAPSFDPPGGDYTTPLAVTITYSDPLMPGTKIYYTTNGSEPTTSSAFVYSGGTVFISTSIRLKAKAITSSHASATASAFYRIIGTSTVIYVDGSRGNDNNSGYDWTSAKKTVQAGIYTAVAGDEVHVATGTYTETINLTTGVKLYGGYSGNGDQRDCVQYLTTLQAARADAAAILPGTGATESTVIDGFTITGGCEGIFFDLSSPMISNNVITGNGYGIFFGQCDSPTIYNNVIKGNDYGIGFGECDSPKILNNIITENTCGIASTLSSPKIYANKITANSDTGIYCIGGIPQMKNNLISANTCWGIKLEEMSDAVIANNTIAANGGGIRCDNSYIMTINNIVAFNSEGILWINAGEGALTRNDVYGNSAYNYSGMTPGFDDISVDPLFADAENGYYHLSSTSPCIEAGNNDPGYVSASDKDIDGEPRVSGGSVDIGADEYWPSP